MFHFIQGYADSIMQTRHYIEAVTLIIIIIIYHIDQNIYLY